MMLGTPGYMAPEQVRGRHTEVLPSTDVFSLGCVMYEGLTGRPCFAGDNLMAACAKILLADPEPVGALCAEAPAALAALVTRMLAKVPSDRPRDAAQVLAALAQVGAVPGSVRRRVGGDAPSTQRLAGPLVGVLMATPATGEEQAAELPAEAARRLGEVAAEHAGQVELLDDGSAIVSFEGAASAELARRAGACALAVRQVMPDALMGVAIGSVDDAIERGARAVARSAADAGGAIGVDDRAAALLPASILQHIRRP
jgi:hypothetical protein